MKTVPPILVITLLLVVSAHADKIILKDGRSIEGNIQEETPDHVKIKTEIGNVFTFTHDEIKQIERDRSSPGDPLLAAALSGIMPGAGQIYNEQPDKAFGFFGAWAAGIYCAVTAFERQPNGTGVYIPHDNTPRFGLGVALIYGSAILSIVDAALIRTEIKRRWEQRRTHFTPAATLDPPMFRATFGIRF